MVFGFLQIHHHQRSPRWWQLKYFSCSPRSLGKWSNLTSIFFRWVVQPPTSRDVCLEYFFRELYQKPWWMSPCRKHHVGSFVETAPCFWDVFFGLVEKSRVEKAHLKDLFSKKKVRKNNEFPHSVKGGRCTTPTCLFFFWDVTEIAGLQSSTLFPSFAG